MDALDGDAHKEDADGDLAPDGGKAVSDFAEPPVLSVRVSFGNAGLAEVRESGTQDTHPHGCHAILRF